MNKSTNWLFADMMKDKSDYGNNECTDVSDGVITEFQMGLPLHY